MLISIFSPLFLKVDWERRAVREVFFSTFPKSGLIKLILKHSLKSIQQLQ